jgi:thiamine-phosphate pyrophosphorylase
VAKGVDLLAVIGGLFATDDVEARARAFTAIFESHKQFESNSPL